MASTTFSVNNGAVTTGTKTFTLQGQTVTEASYIDTTSNLSEPRMAVVSFDLKPIGARGNNRVNVSFKRVKLDASGVAHVLSGTFQLSIPKTTVFSDTDVVDVALNCATYITEARVTSMIDGIVP